MYITIQYYYQFPCYSFAIISIIYKNRDTKEEKKTLYRATQRNIKMIQRYSNHQMPPVIRTLSNTITIIQIIIKYHQNNLNHHQIP